MFDRKHGSNFIDFYYTNSGTFITYDEKALDAVGWISELSNKSEVLNFEICETSMTFHFSKYFQKKAIESFNIFNGQKYGNDFLDISDNDDVFWDILPLITEKYIGENIHKIDQAVKCYRYVINTGKSQRQINEEKLREEYKKREEKALRKDTELSETKKRGFWNRFKK